MDLGLLLYVHLLHSRGFFSRFLPALCISRACLTRVLADPTPRITEVRPKSRTCQKHFSSLLASRKRASRPTETYLNTETMEVSHMGTKGCGSKSGAPTQCLQEYFSTMVRAPKGGGFRLLRIAPTSPWVSKWPKAGIVYIL